MSVVGGGTAGDRLSVSRALHPMGAMTLYLTIDFVLGVTVIITVYRLTTILGRRRGCFGIAEMSHSRSDCIPALGRPLRRLPGT